MAKLGSLRRAAKREIKHCWWTILNRVSPKRHLIVLGDSHASYFDALKLGVLGREGEWRVRVVQVPGATAHGLVKEQSRTNARRIVLKVLAGENRSMPVVLLFGEVDCAFSVWVRSQRDGTTPCQEVGHAVWRYCTFIAEVKGMGFRDVLVATVPPPTISDWQEWHGGDIAHFRRQVPAPLAERTAWVREFNRLLRLESEKGVFRFIDVEQEYIDPRTALVRDGLRMPGNLHLHRLRAARINRRALARMGVIEMTGRDWR